MHKRTPSLFMQRAVEIVRAGGVVVIPTETFYGIAADATHRIAVARIFEIKGRPTTMAVPLVAANLQQVADMLGPLDDRTARVATRFWPGPLSLIVTATPRLSGTGNDQTVAIRVPDHPFVRELASRAGTLLTATSANRTGEPPAQTAAAATASLGDAVDLVVDGGTTPGGLPSTIADVRGEVPRLVREGAVAWERVLESLK